MKLNYMPLRENYFKYKDVDWLKQKGHIMQTLVKKKQERSWAKIQIESQFQCFIDIELEQLNLSELNCLPSFKNGNKMPISQGCSKS